VSPGVVAESLESRGEDPSHGIAAAELAEYYVRSVEGLGTGLIFDARRSHTGS